MRQFDQLKATELFCPKCRTAQPVRERLLLVLPHVRGIVQPMHGRAGMVLSHARQFYGGPPKFKPNPLLIRGFAAAFSGFHSEGFRIPRDGAGLDALT